MKPRNLNQLKKYLKVGVKLKLQRYDEQVLLNRIVDKVQSNGVYFMGDNLTTHSWLGFPKAKDVAFKDDGFVIENCLRYFYVQEEDL
jgi:hypothetical protein